MMGSGMGPWEKPPGPTGHILGGDWAEMPARAWVPSLLHGHLPPPPPLPQTAAPKDCVCQHPQAEGHTAELSPGSQSWETPPFALSHQAEPHPKPGPAPLG